MILSVFSTWSSLFGSSGSIQLDYALCYVFICTLLVLIFRLICEIFN